MRVFLDANVLFSAAHHAESSFRVFFRLAAAGACELVASAFAIDEARRNVGRKNPRKLAELESLVAGVRVCPEGSPATLEWARASALPEKDAPILAAAVQAGADLLVTGDRSHFGRLYGARLRGTEVLPPGPAIERILAAAS
jgi:predicted nucleic acid-binding protein